MHRAWMHELGGEEDDDDDDDDDVLASLNGVFSTPFQLGVSVSTADDAAAATALEDEVRVRAVSHAQCWVYGSG